MVILPPKRYYDHKTCTFVFPDGSGRITLEEKTGLYAMERLKKQFEELKKLIREKLSKSHEII